MAQKIPTDALLLEDEPLIAMDLELILDAEGFSAFTAGSCLEADQWLDCNKPEIVIVDIGLRDGACTEVVARLVEANVPFVVYTGDPPSFHVGSPFTRGTWVSKPATPNELVHAVRAALGGRTALPGCQERHLVEEPVINPL